MSSSDENPKRTNVVIIGGGFAGLACAKELASTDIAVTVIDQRNHNLFQPLLYQVATAALSPADIAEPIRKTLGANDNICSIMGEVAAIDRIKQLVELKDGATVRYDYLIVASGSEYNYFGNEQWKQHAPGLKSIHDARIIRHRLLTAFEKAERINDSDERKKLLTFVIIGGGPTGVEMAGAISELARNMIKREFKRVREGDCQVVLVEAGARILPVFPEKLAEYCASQLRKIGVEIRTNKRVTNITEKSVELQEDEICSSCVIWGAGVRASKASQWLGVEPAEQGRVPVNRYLSLHDDDKVLAIGDTAYALDENGRALPALAQVAKQQGIYAGRRVKSLAHGKVWEEPFRFRNRGNAAVIGRNAAIFDFGQWSLRGRPAWLLWAIVHVYLIISFEKRVLVSIQWATRYFTRRRGARIIDEHYSEARSQGRD